MQISIRQLTSELKQSKTLYHIARIFGFESKMLLTWKPSLSMDVQSDLASKRYPGHLSPQRLGELQHVRLPLAWG